MLPMNQMDQVLAYHMKCDEGFSLEPILEAEIDKGFKEFEEERTAVEKDYFERAQEMVSTVNDLAQDVLHPDPHRTQRSELHRFQQFLDQVKGIRNREAIALEARKKYLGESKRENSALNAELIRGRELLEKKSNQHPFIYFVRDACSKAVGTMEKNK